MNATAPAVELNGLTVELLHGTPIVEDVSLTVQTGEILGLVGESGSGKTTTALALLGFSNRGTRISAGELRIAGERLEQTSEAQARKLRGRRISYVPQDPANALNPSMRIGQAIATMLADHGRGDGGEEAVSRALRSVQLPSDREFARRFPHQLSGGQQQRVCIAVALSCEPPVVVLDEPTTGLDVVTQARILDEVSRLRSELAVSMVYVTHDLAVVSRIANRLAVMYAGRIIETGETSTILRSPRHPYTRGLLASIPDHVNPRRIISMPGTAVGVGERIRGCAFAPRCSLHTAECDVAMPPLEPISSEHAIRCLHHDQTPRIERERLVFKRSAVAPSATPVLEVRNLRAEHRSRRAVVIAAADVSFTLHPGKCLAIVGESGSGKTTIARAIAGLHPLSAGELLLGGEPLPDLARRRSREQRRRVQIIFQNPTDALNPRHTIGEIIARPACALRGLSASDAAAETPALLERVRLPARLIGHYPGELSGGERQRVGIARALAAHPDVIICDEITSALDVSVQAAVLDVLASLRSELQTALLFITHDLGVVAAVADDVLVLEQGTACEHAPVDQVLSTPQNDYTRRLLAAAPSISAIETVQSPT